MQASKELSIVSAKNYAEQFLTSCKLSLSPLSYKSYKTDIEIYFAFLENNDLPFDFSSFKTFLARENQRGLSATTIRRRKSSLQSFFKYLVKNNVADTSLIKKIITPKLPKLLPKSLDREKIMAFLNYAYNKNSADEVMAQVILELLYGSGLRIAEVAGLNIEDIFLDEKRARILGKGNKYRQVPLSTPCVAVLADWLKFRKEILLKNFTEKMPLQENALFISKKAKRLNVRTCREIVYKQAEIRGLEEHLHPHRLRHSFATHMLESSKNIRAVQELLGHSNLNSTQIYTNLDFEHLAKVYDAAHPRANKKD